MKPSPLMQIFAWLTAFGASLALLRLTWDRPVVLLSMAAAWSTFGGAVAAVIGRPVPATFVVLTAGVIVLILLLVGL